MIGYLAPPVMNQGETGDQDLPVLIVQRPVLRRVAFVPFIHLEPSEDTAYERVILYQPDGSGDVDETEGYATLECAAPDERHGIGYTDFFEGSAVLEGEQIDLLHGVRDHERRYIVDVEQDGPVVGIIGSDVRMFT